MPDYSSDYIPVPSIQKHYAPLSDNGISIAKPDMNTFNSVIARVTQEAPDFVKNGELLIPYKTRLDETLRYTDPDIGFNPFDGRLEYKYADAHPVATFRNNIVSGGARFLGAALEAIGTIPIAINAASNKDFSKLYNNDFTNSIHDFLDTLNTELPTYRSEYEDEHPILKYLNPLKLGSFAGAWGGAVNNFGYTAGAIAGALVEDAVITTLTGGAGLFPALAANATQIVRGLSRASKVVVESGAEVRHAMQLVKAADNSLEAVEGTLRGGVSAGRELALTGQAGKFATGTGMKGQSINNFAENIAATGVKKREQIIKNAYTYFKHFRDPAKYHLALLTSAAAEGAFEAADVRHNAEKELRQQFFDTYGHDASPEQLESFKRQAVEAANLTMGANIALLYLTNRLNWGSLFKPTKSALKEGIIGWGRNISRSKVTGVFDDKVGDFVYDVSKNVPSSRIGKVLLNGEKLLKIGAEKGLVESFEEGAQFTFSQGSVDYVLNKYNANNRQQVGDYMSSFLKGIDDTFNTNEGLDNLMGGFIGGIFGGAVMNRVMRGGSVKDQLNTQAKLMNRWNLKGSMEDKMQEVANTVKLAQDHKQAVEAKDTFAAKNFKFKMLFNWVASGVRANAYESRMSELDDVRGFTDDKFEKYWDVEYTPENVEYINNYLDGVKSKAAEIKKDVERVDYLTKNPYNRTKSPLDYNAYESYKDLLALNLSQSREYRRRMESVQNSLRNLAPGLDIQKAVYLTSLQGIRQTMDDIQSNIDQLGLQIKEAQGNEELVNSLYRKHQSLTDILRRLQPLVLNTKVSEEGETIESAFNGKEYVEALQDLFDLYNGIDLQNNKYIERKQKLLGEPNTIYIDGQKEATDSDKLADALEQLQDLRKLAEANFGVERYYHYLRTGKGADEFLKNIKNYATSQMEKIIDQTTGSIKPPEQVEEEVEEQIRFEQGFSQEAEDEIKDDENGSKEEKRENIRKAAKKVVKNQKLTSEEEDLAENHPTAFAHEVKIQQKVKKVIDELLNGVISEVLDSATSSNVSSNNVLTVHDVFGMFSQDKNDMTNRTNLYNAIFNSTDGVFNKIKAVFGLVEPENVVYTKIGKTELYRKSFEENLTITHNNIPIGILRPPTSVYLDAAGERSIFDLKEDEYEKITGNPKNTYSEFMNSLRAYRDSYNKLKAEIEEKQEAGGEVTYQDIAKYFSLSINTGSRKSNTNPANDVILRNLEYKPSGTALISVTLDTIEVKNGVSQKVSVPTIVNRSQLSAEQIAELEKFLETNKDLIAKNINRYAIVVPVLGKYVNKGIIFARNANTDNEEKTRFYNTIKEVASGVYNEDENKINELINNIASEFFLANTDRTTKQVFVNLLFDLDGNTVIHVFNNEKGVNKYINIPKEVVQKTQNYAELINAFNNEISKQESNDRTFASLKLTITQDSLKRQLPKDENITDLKQVEDKLQLAISNPQVFENFNINFTPIIGGANSGSVGTTPSPTEPTLPTNLSKSNPTYNYGSHHFDLEFETDIDKAAFISAQKTKSKRDADFVKFVMQHTNLTEEQVRELGGFIKEDIKHNAKLLIEVNNGESIISVDKTYDEFIKNQTSDEVEPEVVYVENKEELTFLLGKYFGLTQEQAEASADIFERVAQAWATRTGRPIQEFFQTLGFGEKELFNATYNPDNENILYAGNYTTDKVAREVFPNIEDYKLIGKGSDRDVYDIGDNRVVKVAKTARGLTQNNAENDVVLQENNIIPKVFEQGLNYIVAEKVEQADKYEYTINNIQGKWFVVGTNAFEQLENPDNEKFIPARSKQDATDIKKRLDDNNIVAKFIREFENVDTTDEKKAILNKYGISDVVLNYPMLIGDFGNIENWGIRDGKPIHLDGGTFYGETLISDYKGKKDLDDKDFKDIYFRSEKIKSQLGVDTDLNYQGAIENVEKIVKGFELQPVYANKLFLGFRTKNNIANRTIVKAIYKWSKENDLNVIPRYNLTYGTIELVPVKSTGVLFQLNTWHGSPYNISRFSTSRVYTGEGQTVFGWGLYFTDLKGVAEHYANNLNWKNKLYKFNSLTIEELSKKSSGFHPMVAHFLTKVIANNPINNAALYSEYLKLKESKKINVSEKVDNQIKFLIENAKIDNNKKRNLYRVTLHKGKSPEQYTWLEWDKPINDENLNQIAKEIYKIKGESILLNSDSGNFETIFAKNDRGITTAYILNKKTGEKVLANKSDNRYNEIQVESIKNSLKSGLFNNGKNNGETLYKQLKIILGSDKNASLFLLENGIDGIKYPAESISRGATSDNARGFNYVVFDENAIEIEEHIVFQNAKAAYDKLKQIIYALTNPNVSSPIHELAHFWHGVTEGKDKNTLLTDEEIKQVLEWTKTPEWTTETSEAFAKGFETYLAEGKAPSPELENVFQKFAKWLAEIYKDIKQALGIELNDNMRQIYARMLNSQFISDSVSATIDEANNIQKTVVSSKVEKRMLSSVIEGLSNGFLKIKTNILNTASDLLDKISEITSSDEENNIRYSALNKNINNLIEQIEQTEDGNLKKELLEQVNNELAKANHLTVYSKTIPAGIKFTNKGYLILKNVVNLPENVEFRSGRSKTIGLELPMLKTFPASTVFKNHSSIEAPNLIEIPSNTVFNNKGILGVYNIGDEERVLKIGDNVRFENKGFVAHRITIETGENIYFEDGRYNRNFMRKGITFGKNASISLFVKDIPENYIFDNKAVNIIPTINDDGTIDNTKVKLPKGVKFTKNVKFVVFNNLILEGDFKIDSIFIKKSDITNAKFAAKEKLSVSGTNISNLKVKDSNNVEIMYGDIPDNYVFDNKGEILIHNANIGTNVTFENKRMVHIIGSTVGGGVYFNNRGEVLTDFDMTENMRVGNNAAFRNIAVITNRGSAPKGISTSMTNKSVGSVLSNERFKNSFSHVYELHMNRKVPGYTLSSEGTYYTIEINDNSSKFQDDLYDLFEFHKMSNKRLLGWIGGKVDNKNKILYVTEVQSDLLQNTYILSKRYQEEAFLTKLLARLAQGQTANIKITVNNLIEEAISNNRSLREEAIKQGVVTEKEFPEDFPYVSKFGNKVISREIAALKSSIENTYSGWYYTFFSTAIKEAINLNLDTIRIPTSKYYSKGIAGVKNVSVLYDKLATRYPYKIIKEEGGGVEWYEIKISDIYTNMNPFAYNTADVIMKAAISAWVKTLKKESPGLDSDYNLALDYLPRLENLVEVKGYLSSEDGKRHLNKIKEWIEEEFSKEQPKQDISDNSEEGGVLVDPEGNEINEGYEETEVDRLVKESLENKKYIHTQLDVDFLLDELSEAISENQADRIAVIKQLLSEISNVTNKDIKFSYDSDGKIDGFTYNGEIYLTNENVSFDTTFEEAGHIWIEWAKKNRVDLYNEGIKKVIDTEYVKEVLDTEFYVREALKFGKAGSEGFNKYIYEEALSKAIREGGARIVSSSKKRSFKSWLNTLWEELRKLFGLHEMSIEEVSKLSMNEFAERVAADLFNNYKEKNKSETPKETFDKNPYRLTPEANIDMRTSWANDEETDYFIIDNNGKKLILKPYSSYTEAVEALNGINTLNGFEINEQSEQTGKKLPKDVTLEDIKQELSKYATVETSPISGHLIINGNVQLDINQVDGSWHIISITSLEKNKGYATKAMEAIVQAADNLNIVLQLEATPLDPSGLTKAQLVDFYKKFGFTVTTGQYGMDNEADILEYTLNSEREPVEMARLPIGLQETEKVEENVSSEPRALTQQEENFINTLKNNSSELKGIYGNVIKDMLDVEDYAAIVDLMRSQFVDDTSTAKSILGDTSYNAFLELTGVQDGSSNVDEILSSSPNVEDVIEPDIEEQPAQKSEAKYVFYKENVDGKIETNIGRVVSQEGVITTIERNGIQFDRLSDTLSPATEQEYKNSNPEEARETSKYKKGDKVVYGQDKGKYTITGSKQVKLEDNINHTFYTTEEGVDILESGIHGYARLEPVQRSLAVKREHETRRRILDRIGKRLQALFPQIKYEIGYFDFNAPARFNHGVVEINVGYGDRKYTQAEINALENNDIFNVPWLKRESIAHEFMHPFIEAVKISNKPLYNNLAKEILDKADIMAHVDNLIKSGTYNESDRIDEAIAIFLGREITRAFDKSGIINREYIRNRKNNLVRRFLKWLNDVIDYITGRNKPYSLDEFIQKANTGVKYTEKNIRGVVNKKDKNGKFVYPDLDKLYKKHMDNSSFIRALNKELNILGNENFAEKYGITSKRDLDTLLTNIDDYITGNNKGNIIFGKRTNLKSTVEFEETDDNKLYVYIDPSGLNEISAPSFLTAFSNRIVDNELAKEYEKVINDNFYRKTKDKKDSKVMGVDALNPIMKLQDISDFLISQLDQDTASIESIEYTGYELSAIDELEKYMELSEPEAKKIRERVMRNWKGLQDIATKRLNNEDLKIQSNVIRRLDLDSQNDIEFVLRYTQQAAQAINLAVRKYGKLREELKSPGLTQAKLNRLNKELEVIKQLVSFYDEFNKLYSLYDESFNDADKIKFLKATSSLQYIRDSMANTAIDLTLEWLMPYIDKHNAELKKLGYSEKYMTTRQMMYNNLKFGTNKDTNFITFNLGTNVESRDPVNAAFANTISDNRSLQTLHIQNDTTELNIAYDNFLKENNISSVNYGAQIEFYKKHYYRQAEVLVFKIDEITGEKTEEYITKTALHQEFFFDKYEKDLSEVKKKYSNPRSGIEAEEFDTKIIEWQRANSFGKSEKYRNPEYHKLNSDKFFKVIENFYNINNAKYGENALNFGIIPQKYDANIIDKLQDFVKGVKAGKNVEEQYQFVKDKIVSSAAGMKKDNTSINLDGTVYRRIKTELTSMKQEKNISFDIKNVIEGFISEATDYSAMRDIQYNAETLRMLIEGNVKFSVPSRLIGKENFNARIKDDLTMGKVKSKFKELKDLKDAGLSYDKDLYEKLEEKIKKGVEKKSLWDDFLPRLKPSGTDMLNKMLIQQMNDFFYGDAVEDQKIGKISATKAAHYVSLYTSLVNMGLNWKAAISNINIGNLQLFIEGHGGKYFNKKELSEAIADYIKNIPNYARDLQVPIKSKDTQLAMLLDAIQGEVFDENRNRVTGSIAKRMFTVNNLFLLTNLGEHQIQITGMKAMLKGRKVETKNGEKITLYDAYTADKNGRYSLRTDLKDFTQEDLQKFIRELHGVNRNLNGNYSDLHKTTLARKWYGTLLLKFRKYLYPAFRSRFASEHIDYERNIVETGYLRFFFKDYLFGGLKRIIREHTIKGFSKEGFTEQEKYQFRKAVFELSSYAALTVLGMALGGGFSDDDKKKEISDFQKYLLYFTLRLRSDVGMYHVDMPSEFIRQIKNPTASLTAIVNGMGFIGQLWSPTEVYEKDSGTHEAGDSKLWAKAQKLIPVYNKFLVNIDDQLGYFNLINRDIEGVSPKRSTP